MEEFKFIIIITNLFGFTVFPTVFATKQPTNLQILIGTENGPIIGQQEFTLYDEKPYYAFRGIPYAKPPIGDLRFRPPVAITPWNETLLALDYGNICQQLSGGNEDCLFVNVYTPNVSTLANLPVTIGIHGGGYTDGSGNVIGPDLIFNEADCVMVTINYRLGALGFLSLNTTEYPGNMGLKDQLLAIKWTKVNIHHFGGDPNRITLYGLSAGSSSVHLHILSTSSRGLFQRAILSSGTALNPMALGNLSQHLPILYLFVNSQENSHIAQEIREFYFVSNGGEVNEVSMLEFTELASDILFHYAIDRSVKLHAIGVENSPTKANTYYYRFSVEAMLNFLRMLSHAPMLGLPGATHGDDVFYGFGNINYLRPIFELLPPLSLERRAIHDFSQMFANFIVNGEPNFKPVRPGEQNFMDFTNDGLIDGIDPQRNISEFWDNLFERHNMW